MAVVTRLGRSSLRSCAVQPPLAEALRRHRERERVGDRKAEGGPPQEGDELDAGGTVDRPALLVPGRESRHGGERTIETYSAIVVASRRRNRRSSWGRRGGDDGTRDIVVARAPAFLTPAG